MTSMDYAFFASDGASSVEVALKMALQYWQHAGEPRRTRFVHLRDSYHGDTAGAMSVSDIALFRSRYGALTFETRAYDEAPQVINGSDVAAVIVEPIVQAAAGIRIVERERYASFRTMKPLLIVDEIATGFGRTGTLFAFKQLDITPDIVTVGKGITGGTLALSAAVARAPVYEAFLGAPAEMKQLFHGHSYAGNPIACAAALANIAVFEEEATMERVASATRHISPALKTVSSHAAVRQTRQAGMMVAIEVEPLHLPQPRATSAAWDVANALYERGHFTRPIGDVVQFVPPLNSTPVEIDGFFESLLETLG
jgi:adenosylmethionine-8-amino-7-oxononanoate aminotransferase